MDKIYADDLHVGAVYPFGTYEVTLDELIEFATQWDPQDFHTDADAAARSVYGGLIASGVHTIAINQRLSVEAVYRHWHVIAGHSLGDVRFVRPVRAGDVLSGHAEITAVAPEPDRGRAVVGVAMTVTNGTGRPVLTASTDLYVHLAPRS
ncbi:acyl dehydratase [Gordonia spumicola]|uniref:Acyl dehydratase n=1 Tax=Gordonia spumicola TaxID=589161 RepID=A0A7I9V3K2_9ACTN|nr:MaoC/PaaZ C-terminal domain-containing protein [Gordonia spumicola]GED99995.1 acyl dehydratase [Gordonia spumicola]